MRLLPLVEASGGFGIWDIALHERGTRYPDAPADSLAYERDDLVGLIQNQNGRQPVMLYDATSYDGLDGPYLVDDEKAWRKLPAWSERDTR